MALHVGVGRSDITPPDDIPNGMWMAQTHVRAEGIHQALWLTVLALSDDGEAALLLDIDWCLLSDRQVVALRRAVSEATGVAEERILPVCTHQHAGPVTQDSYAGEGADEVAAYVATLPDKAVAASLEAIRSSVPARVAVGWGISDVGVNRDLRLPDGRTVAGPNPSGHADQAVGVVRVEREDGSPLAILVNYACHPTVLGPGNRLVSPDYPGSTKRVVERLTGATCLFLQGAAGDMGPIEGFVDDVAVAERLGTRLGLEAAKVALSLDARPVRRRLDHVVASGAPLAMFSEEPTGAPPDRLSVRSARLGLPVRADLPTVFSQAPERLAAWSEQLETRRAIGAPATAIAEAQQNVERERLRAQRFATYRSSREVEVEMHVARLGPAALVLTWGEPYSWIGSEIKRRSPVPDTLVCGYVGGDPLYVATPEAYRPPVPFQVENCPFTPEASAVMVDAALDLLREVVVDTVDD